MTSLDGCGKFLKYSIFIVNLLIFLTGMVILGLGIWALADGVQLGRILGDHQYKSSASILLTLGGSVAFIAFLGCCGAIKEIKCLLLTFFIILLVISIIIIIGIVFAFKMKDKVEQTMEDGLLSTMADYKYDETIKNAWDDFQKIFHCCGSRSFSDWVKVRTDIPESCTCMASEEEGDTCFDELDGSPAVWQEGCFVAIKEEIKRHATPLVGVGLAIIVIIFFSMVFSCGLFLLL